MPLQPPGHGRGVAIGEQGQRPPPGEVEPEGTVGVARAQRDVVHAEDLRGADHRVRDAADDAQPRVATHRESKMPAEPHPSRPTQSPAAGAEACRQPQRPPGPRVCHTRPSLGGDATCAGGLPAAELPDAELPGAPIATPRAIGQRPCVAAVDVPSRSMAPGAPGCRLQG
jgi:hypothetical protein